MTVASIVRCLSVAGLAVLTSCIATKPDRSAPSSIHDIIPAVALQNDVTILAKAYGDLHPGLYRYNTPSQIDDALNDLRRTFAHDQTRASAFLALSQFTATVKCGHTYANFYNQTQSVQNSLFKNANRVPFYFRWIDGKMIVTRNFSDDTRIVPGTEILSIDDIPTSDILRRLMTIARADGSNDAKRVAYLEVQGQDTYEAFDIFLPLFYPKIRTEQRLRLRSPDGSQWSRTVRAVSYQERLSERPEDGGKETLPWTLSFPNKNVALLNMPTWVMYNRKVDWHAYIRKAFETISDKHSESLIIDLRANEGGDDVGDAILSHLIDRDLVLPGYLRLVRYRRVPDDLLPYLDTWDKSFDDWGANAVPYDDRYYRLTRYDDDARGHVVKSEAPVFKGRLIVLIGPTNSSATFQFAQEVRTLHLGALVGSETGGNLRGINGGAFFFLRLPGSGLEVDLPLIGTFPTTPQNDAGITPDVRVPVTADDIAQSRDAVLDDAQRIAR
ncbi:S41 family peptidase [Dyella sp. 2HG41-7]|uniref:S41 family peptidase n=1 Tax=Dyella sp. 2HG41-7 TaxID=2883239 RepID=UPI001F33CFBC|nr:S41 family peptidase [Dyella sp. 2HG41-7]